MAYLILAYFLLSLITFYNSSFILNLYTWKMVNNTLLTTDFMKLLYSYFSLSLILPIYIIAPYAVVIMYAFIKPMVTAIEFKKVYYRILNQFCLVYYMYYIIYYLLFILLYQIYKIINNNNYNLINIIPSANMYLHYLNVFLVFTIIISVCISLISYLVNFNLIKINYIINRKAIIIIAIICSLCTPPDITAMIIITVAATVIYESIILYTLICSTSKI